MRDGIAFQATVDELQPLETVDFPWSELELIAQGTDEVAAFNPDIE